MGLAGRLGRARGRVRDAHTGLLRPAADHPPGLRRGHVLPRGAAAGRDANQIVQLSGDDRFATAAAIAEHGFPEADVAVLVSGEDRHLVDALSAAPLARSLAAPVLLGTRDSVPAATASYLQKHQVKAVLLVGGADALGEATTGRLQALGVTSVARVPASTATPPRGPSSPSCPRPRTAGRPRVRTPTSSTPSPRPARPRAWPNRCSWSPTPTRCPRPPP